MKRKPIKIDWEELEDAFAGPPEEVAYLDGVTGHVVLEGEGEEDEDDLDEVGLPPAAAAPRTDPTRISIQPPGPDEKIEWMKAFIAQGGHDSEVIQGLERGLADENPPAALSQVLNDNPDVRDAWYLYRTERLRELIEDWLKANGIEAVTPPPWK